MSSIPIMISWLLLSRLWMYSWNISRTFWRSFGDMRSELFFNYMYKLKLYIWGCGLELVHGRYDVTIERGWSFHLNNKLVCHREQWSDSHFCICPQSFPKSIVDTPLSSKIFFVDGSGVMFNTEIFHNEHNCFL